MIRTIWLASYPKSGNTWMRVLVANASNPSDRPVDINEIPGDGMASHRHSFDYAVLIDSSLLTHDEIDCLRPRAYTALVSLLRDRFEDGPKNPDVPPARFVKVHDAYTTNSAGAPLLGGAQGADAAIVIVRDPRDIAPSLANHSDISVDQAIAIMEDDDAAMCKKTDRLHTQLRHKLRSWSDHVASWLDQKDIPVHLVRYEDLRIDTVATLSRALTFAGVPATGTEIEQAVAFSDFAKLRQQEEEKGFRETPPRPRTQFFRRGEAGNWRDELTVEQVTRIESRHERMMLRLGYDLSYVSRLARAG